MPYTNDDFSKNQCPCNSSHCPFGGSFPNSDSEPNLEGTEAENEAKKPCHGNDTVHIIKKGDTCWHLAMQYNTTVETIMAANPGMSCNALPVGAPLCIPKKVLSHCPPGTFPHVIKKGDTCWHIAQQYGMSIATIMAVNPGMDCNNLPLGGILCIPHQRMNEENNAPEATCMTGTAPYVIQAGDTCYSLANKYGTTVNAIMAANPGLNCNLLQIGSTICIPTMMPACPAGTTSYMIKQGDTCYSLANKYGTTVNAILAANPGLNCNSLQIGSTICIPTPTPACPGNMISYIIQPGDTCYALAQKYGVTVNAIIAANPGLNCNNLRVGATICIPAMVTCGSGTFTYIIQPGDTCAGLAQKYGTTVSAIMTANPGVNCNNLMVGATLCIPSICPMNAIPYVVQLGDTCYSLALKYNTSVADIMAMNPGINCNYLQIGSIVCIPTAPTSNCQPGSIPIVIQAGDTCMSLAQKYGTTVNAIMAVNPGLNCNNLQVGAVICIPSTCPLGSVPYVIKAGDTCYALAQKFGTSVNAIIAANPGINCNNLQIGTTICIP